MPIDPNKSASEWLQEGVVTGKIDNEGSFNAALDTLTNGEWRGGNVFDPRFPDPSNEFSYPIMPDIDTWRKDVWKPMDTTIKNDAGESLPAFAQGWDYWGRPYFGEGLEGWGNGVRSRFAAIFNPANEELAKKYTDIAFELNDQMVQQRKDEPWRWIPGASFVDSIYSLAKGEGPGHAGMALAQAMMLYEATIESGGALSSATRAQSALTGSVIDGLDRLGIWAKQSVSAAYLQGMWDDPNTEGGSFWDKYDMAYEGGRMLGTAIWDKTARTEFIRRVNEGQDPRWVAMELQNPIAELVTELIVDPLNFISPMIKAAKFAGKYQNVSDFIRAGSKYTDIMGDAAVGLDKIDDLGARKLVDDMAETLAGDLQAAAKWQDTASTTTNVFLNADGLRSVTGESTRVWLLAGVEAARKAGYNANDMIHAIKTVILMGDGSDINKVREALLNLRHMPSADFLLSPAAQKMAVMFNAIGDPMKAARKMFKANTIDEFVAASDDVLDTVLKAAFPSVADRIKKIEKLTKAGKAIPPGLEPGQLLRKLDASHTNIQKLWGPMTRTYSAVFMGYNPGYAMRNHFTNSIGIWVDEGFKAAFAPFGNVMEKAKFHGLEEMGLAVFFDKGAVPGIGETIENIDNLFSLKPGNWASLDRPISRFSQVIERRGKLRAAVFTYERSMRHALREGLAIPDMQKLVDLGMTSADAKVLSRMLLDDLGKDPQAVLAKWREAKKTGFYEVFRQLDYHMDDGMQTAARKVGLEDEFVRILNEAKNPEDATRQLDDLLERWKQDAKPAYGEHFRPATEAPIQGTDDLIALEGNIPEDAYNVLSNRAAARHYAEQQLRSAGVQHFDMAVDAAKKANDPEMLAQLLDVQKQHRGFLQNELGRELMDEVVAVRARTMAISPVGTARLSKNQRIAKAMKYGSFEEAWKAWGLGDPPHSDLTLSELYDGLWANYSNIYEANTLKIHELTLAAGDEFRDALKAVAKGIDPPEGAYQAAEQLIEQSRRIHQAEIVDGVMKLPQDFAETIAKEPKNALQTLGTQYGITDPDHLLNAINKQSRIESGFDAAELAAENAVAAADNVVAKPSALEGLATPSTRQAVELQQGLQPGVVDTPAARQFQNTVDLVAENLPINDGDEAAKIIGRLPEKTRQKMAEVATLKAELDDLQRAQRGLIEDVRRTVQSKPPSSNITRSGADVFYNGEKLELIGSGAYRAAYALPDGRVIKIATGTNGLDELAQFSRAPDELKPFLLQPQDAGYFVDEAGNHLYYQIMERVKPLNEVITPQAVDRIDVLRDVRDAPDSAIEELFERYSLGMDGFEFSISEKRKLVATQLEGQLGQLVQQMRTSGTSDFSHPLIQQAYPDLAKQYNKFEELMADTFGRHDFFLSNNLGVASDGRLLSIDYSDFREIPLEKGVKPAIDEAIQAIDGFFITDMSNQIDEMPEILSLLDEGVEATGIISMGKKRPGFAFYTTRIEELFNGEDYFGVFKHLPPEKASRLRSLVASLEPDEIASLGKDGTYRVQRVLETALSHVQSGGTLDDFVEQVAEVGVDAIDTIVPKIQPPATPRNVDFPRQALDDMIAPAVDEVAPVVDNVAPVPAQKLGAQVEYDNLGDVPFEEGRRLLEARAAAGGQEIVDINKVTSHGDSVLPPFTDHVAPTGTRAIAENMPGVEELINEFRRSLRSKWGHVQAAGGDETPELAAAFNDWSQELVYRVGHSKGASVLMGNAMADFTLINYGQRGGADLALAYLYPYSFWHTRTYANWMKRIATNGDAIARYAHLRTALEKIHAGQPEWYKYNINSNEILGILGIESDNPLFFNLEATFNPMYGMMKEDFTDPQRRVNWWTNTLEDLGKFGPSTHPILSILTALYLESNGEEEAASRWAGRMFPQTQAFKSATSLLGIGGPGGLEVDPYVNLLSDGMTPYERNRVASALGSLMEKYPNMQEAILEASRTREGPIWDEAMRIAAKARDFGNLTSFMFGVGFKGRTQEEMEMERAMQNWYTLWAQRDNLSPDEFRQAIRQVNDAFPQLEPALLARRGTLQRDTAYAYNVLGRLPPGDSLAALAGIDYDLVGKFYETKGDLTLMTEGDRLRFMSAVVDAGAMLQIPSTATRQEWEEVRSQGRTLRTILSRAWGEDIFDKIDGFYMAEDKNAYLAAHPEVERAMDMRAELIMKDPLMNAYYGGIDTIEKYYTSKMYDQLYREFPGIRETWDEYWRLKDSGQEKLASQFWRNHPELKKYQAVKADYLAQANAKILELAQKLPDIQTAQLRTDADAAGVGEQAVAGQIQPQEPALTAERIRSALPPAVYEQILDLVFSGEQMDTFAMEAVQNLAMQLQMTPEEVIQLATSDVQ